MRAAEIARIVLGRLKPLLPHHSVGGQGMVAGGLPIVAGRAGVSVQVVKPGGPQVISFEELPEIFQINPVFRPCLNRELPATTKRITHIFERLLQHPRFQKYGDKMLPALMDNPGAASIVSPGENSKFQYVVCFLHTEALYAIYENEGMLCDDQIAFILAHELCHYAKCQENAKEKLSHEEERQCDVEALQLMDEAGYSVHFASLTAVLGKSSQNQVSAGLTHPDIWWRQMNLEERILGNHFKNYREISAFPFDPVAVAEVSSLHRRSALWKEAEASFKQASLYNYASRVEKVNSSEELILHMTNLIFHFWLELSKLPVFAADLAKKKARIVNIADNYYLDLKEDYSYLDGIDLKGLEAVVQKEIKNDEFFARYQLADDPKENLRQRKKIVQVLLRLDILNHIRTSLDLELFGDSRVADYISIVHLVTGTGELAYPEIKEKTCHFKRGVERLLAVTARSTNPGLVHFAALVEQTTHGKFAANLNFDRKAMELLLAAWPLRGVFEKQSVNKPQPVFHDSAYISMATRISDWLYKGRSNAVERSVKENPEIFRAAFYDKKNDLDFYLNVRGQLSSVFGKTELGVFDHLALCFDAWHDIPEKIEECITLIIKARFGSTEVLARIEYLIKELEIRAAYGEGASRELYDLDFLFGLLDKEQQIALWAAHFCFFEAHLLGRYGQQLIETAPRVEFCEVPGWAKSETAKKLFNFLQFIKRPQIEKYYELSFSKLDIFSLIGLWFKLESPEEMRQLASLYLSSFDKVQLFFNKFTMREQAAWARSGDTSLLLFIVVNLILENKAEELEKINTGQYKTDYNAPGVRVPPFASGYQQYVAAYFSQYLATPNLRLAYLQLDNVGQNKFYPGYGFDQLTDNQLETIIIKLYEIAVALVEDREDASSVERLLADLQYLYLNRRLLLTGKEQESGVVMPLYLLSERNIEFTRLMFDRRYGVFAKKGTSFEEGFCLGGTIIKETLWFGAEPVERLPFFCGPAPVILCAAEIVRAAKDSNQFCRTFRQKYAVKYEDEVPLHPNKRISVLAVGDYLAYQLFMTKPKPENCQRLIACFDEFWQVPSEMRDVVIVNFLEEWGNSIDDLMSLLPQVKDKERLAKPCFEAYQDYLEQNQAGSFDEKIGQLIKLFPEASQNRDQLLLDLAMDYPLDFSRYQEIKALLMADKASGKRSMLEEHGLLEALTRYSATDRASMLLWILGFLPSAPQAFVKDCEKQKLLPDWVKEALVLPDERRHFMKAILIGSDGLCLPKNQLIKGRLLTDVFENIFGQQRSKQENFVLELAKIVFAEIEPYKQYIMLEALFSLLFQCSRNGTKTMLEDVVRSFLENIGPEGVKLAQILSSYQSLWDAEPRLARVLSDLQDRSSVMHHFYFFRQLIADFGEEKVAGLSIDPPCRGGSIKGFFVGRAEGEAPVGFLYRRPQVSKFLEENQKEMIRILEKAEPVVLKYYRGQIPPRIPEMIVALVRREIDFDRERAIIRDCSQSSDANYEYPALDPAWQSNTIIGETYISPHISLKRLLALENDGSEWQRCSPEEQAQVRQMMGWQETDPFDPPTFAAKLQNIKAQDQRGSLTHLVAGKYFHLDPHPGNKLIQVRDGVPYLVLTDLGAMVSLAEKDKRFVGLSLTALTMQNVELLEMALREYFGQDISAEIIATILSAELKYRPVRLLEMLDRQKLELPLVMRELLLAISKAGPILDIYKENMAFYLELAEMIEPS